VSDTRAKVQRRAARSAKAMLLFAPLLFAACSSAHPRGGVEAPPVIEETFTPLDCPAGRAARETTLGAEGCLERSILRTDAKINRRVRTIFRLLSDRGAKRRFVAGERAWHTYRQKVCEGEADIYRGGSAEPVAFASCELERNRTHLRELGAFELVLRRR